MCFQLPHRLNKIEVFNGNCSFLFSVWSLEKLANKIYDMRDLYNQCVEENIPFSETVGAGLIRRSQYVHFGVSRGFSSFRGCKRDFLLNK